MCRQIISFPFSKYVDGIFYMKNGISNIYRGENSFILPSKYTQTFWSKYTPILRLCGQHLLMGHTYKQLIIIFKTSFFISVYGVSYISIVFFKSQLMGLC